MRKTQFAREIIKSAKAGDMQRANDYLKDFLRTNDINSRMGFSANTLMHKAVKADLVDLAKLLRENGAKVNSLVNNLWGRSPLGVGLKKAAYSSPDDSLEMVYFLVKEARKSAKEMDSRLGYPSSIIDR